MGGQEQRFVQEAFDTNWISPVGPHITAFEKELAAYLGVSHVAALSSGTAAIHLALVILGVGPGDEVICSSFTFSASANPVRYVGAEPIFVDSEASTWNMDPELLHEAIRQRIHAGKKPKAIIPVHLYGMPAHIEDIVNIAAEYDIPVIEDAAEALGSTSADKKMGTFGTFGILSFNGNKIITTSGGGALVLQSEEAATRARFLATQARDPAPHYEHSTIGYNYRLSNVCAGIGRGQLLVLDEHVEARRSNFEFYRKSLGDLGLEFLPERPGAISNRWLTTVLMPAGGPAPLDLMKALENQSIESRPLWKPMHLQPVYKDCLCFGGSVSSDLFARGLCLPSGSSMSEEDLEKVVSAVRQFFG